MAKLITAEAFACMSELSDGERHELIRGRVVAEPLSGFRQGYFKVQIMSAINRFVEQHDLGTFVSTMGVITEENPDTVRSLDLSFWSYKTLPDDLLIEEYPDFAPDFAVEFLANEDRTQAMRGKVAELLAFGVKLLWLVDVQRERIIGYQGRQPPRVLDASATIDGGDVLPGFACPVAEFFA